MSSPDQHVCEFCGAVGATGKTGRKKCKVCGKQREGAMNSNPESGFQKAKNTATFLGGMGFAFVVAVLALVGGIWLLVGIIKNMPNHPVTDWMQNQKYEREEHERRREEQ